MARPYDVIVVGLGAMGSAAAAHLARRGRRVLGLDRHTPPHDRGSSHGGTRIIRCAYFEGAGYVPLVLRAWEQWERLEAYAGRPLLTRTGGLMIGPPASEVVAASRHSAQCHGLPHEMLDPAGVHRRWPALTPPPGSVALYEERAGFVRPELAVTVFLRAAESLGATLVVEEPVLRWEADGSGGGVRVETPRGTYEATGLVLAAGAWTPEVAGDLGLPLEIERQVQCWFEPRGPADVPIFLWQGDDGTIFGGMPPHDGDGVKVGIHHEGAGCTPETVDRTVHPEEIEALRGRLAVIAPSLDGSVQRADTCLYTNTPDHHFVIGLHPARPQVAVAAGFSGHGFKFAPVVGEILADLVTEGSTAHGIGLFDPERFPVAGAGGG